MARKTLELTGQRFGKWTVLGRADVDSHKTWWACLCDCGNTQIVRGSNLTRGDTNMCRDCRARKRSDAMRLPDDSVTYKAVHIRLVRERGRASEFSCVECDEKAEQWAYQHGDSAELESPWRGQDGATRTVKFTPNLSAYEPMCRRCHTALDKTMARA